MDDTAERLGAGRRLVLVAGANELEPLVHYLAALSAGHAVLLAPGDDTEAADALIRTYDPDITYRRTDGHWLLEHRHVEPVHELHPDLAVLLTTSGSTGSPKLVRLSHDNLQANAAAIADVLDIRATDRAATTLPLHYCYGLSVVHSHLLAGAGLVLTDLSVVDPCFWELFTAAGGTSFAGVPYTFDLLERIPFAELAPPSLRYVTQAGGRLSPERVRELAELGCRQGWDLVVMYGQTEATARMAYLPPALAAEAPGAIGIPIPGGELDIDDGELVYRGANVMLGYAETPADLALGRNVEELRTGDLGRRTPDGLYEVVGRRSRFAKVLGHRIDLQHLEQSLDVVACCVEDGGRLVAAVEGAADAADLARRIAQRCSLPARAVRVVSVDALPRLPSGKPDLQAVARLAAESTPPPPDRGDVRQLYAQVLERPDVTEDSTFVSLGGDSLSYVEMSLRLERDLGHLPADWHLLPVRRLRRLARRSGRPTLETSVALRALAILLIVGTHADVFDLSGGAHVLLAVAGFNVARFALSRPERLDRVRRLLVSTGRIAAPSVVWIAAVVALTGQYGPANVLLLNEVVGPPSWSPEWHFWFLEALVHLLLGLAALLAVPPLHRLERRHPLRFAGTVLAVGLVARYAADGVNSIHTTPGLLWLFALGWAAALATTARHRLLLTAVLVLAMPGFFTDPRRGAFVVAGVALLVWVRSLPSRRALNRVAGVLAASSLYVYLTHWQVYPHLERDAPLLAAAAAFVVGIAYWQLMTRVTTRLAGRMERPLVRVP